MKKLNELFEQYTIDLERRGCKTIPGIKRIYDQDIKKVLGNMPISKVKRGDIKQLHFDISARAPFTANKILTILKAMFNLAISLSLVENNPATHISKNRENKRKRYLTNDELIKIVKEMNRLEKNKIYQKSILFIWLLILTGARKGEIAQAKWTDLQDNKLIIKNHKTDRLGEERILYLSPQAISLIRKHHDAKGDGYIVGIKSPRRAFETILRNCKIDNVRIHDLRHSYASWSLQVVKLSDVGGLLGHKDAATTNRYAHIHDDRNIENANKIGAHLESLFKNL
jgi:integrase